MFFGRVGVWIWVSPLPFVLELMTEAPWLLQVNVSRSDRAPKSFLEKQSASGAPWQLSHTACEQRNATQAVPK